MCDHHHNFPFIYNAHRPNANLSWRVVFHILLHSKTDIVYHEIIEMDRITATTKQDLFSDTATPLL